MLNGLIFWDTQNADYAAGQRLPQKCDVARRVQAGSSPRSTALFRSVDIDLSDAGLSTLSARRRREPCGRRRREPGRLSPGQNMAQTKKTPQRRRWRDVLSEFVHNNNRSPPQRPQTNGLADAAEHSALIPKMRSPSVSARQGPCAKAPEEPASCLAQMV